MRSLYALAVLVALWTSVKGQDEASQFGAMIRVMGPPSLRVQLPYQWSPPGPSADGTGRIEARPSFFGKPEFGHPTSGTLVYPYLNEADGCSEIEPDLISRWPSDSEHPVIVMVDRGDCRFTEKVLHVQNACRNSHSGSRCTTPLAAIIVDNRDADGPDFHLPYMAGSNPDIKIPAMIISKENGAILKAKLNDATYHGEVIVRLSWSLPRPDNRVEWELFYNPYDIRTRDIFTGARRINMAMGEDALFIPHLQIIPGNPVYRCVDSFPACAKQCINHGRYCEVDPERNLHEGLDGTDILYEGMRQQCVWVYDNGYTHDGAVIVNPGRPKTAMARASELFFDYVNLWHDKCFPNRVRPGASEFMRTCSIEQLRSLETAGNPGLVEFVTNTCYFAFGDVGHANNNTLINYDDDIERRRELNVFPHTAIVAINEFMYIGELECNEEHIDQSNCGVLEAICSGFNSTVPEACKGAIGCDLGLVRDICGICGGNGKSCLGCDGVPNSGLREDRCGVCGGDGKSCPEGSGSNVTGVVAAVVSLSVAAIALGVFFIVRRQRRSEQRIDDILAQYSPLEATPARDARQSLMPADQETSDEV